MATFEKVFFQIDSDELMVHSGHLTLLDGFQIKHWHSAMPVVR